MRVLYRLQSQMPRTLSMPGFFAPASTTSRQFFWASKSHGLIIGLLVRSLTTILTFVISSQQLSPGLFWSGLYVQNNGFDFGPGPFSSQVHHPENQMIPGSSYMTINVWMWDETDWWVYVCSFCCIWWQTYRQLNNLLPIANTDTLVLLLISILFKTMCNHQYSFADTNTLLLLLLLISILFKTMRNHDKRNTGQPTGLLNLARGISLGKIQSASLVQLNLSTLFLFDFFWWLQPNQRFFTSPWHHALFFPNSGVGMCEEQVASDVARQGGGSLLPFLLEGIPISKAYLKATLAATDWPRYSFRFVT